MSRMSEAEFEAHMGARDAEIGSRKDANADLEKRLTDANAQLEAIERKTAELSRLTEEGAPVEDLAAMHKALDVLVAKAADSVPDDEIPPDLYEAEGGDSGETTSPGKSSSDGAEE